MSAGRRRVAAGPARPQYFHNEENDRMFMILAALAAEISTLRDRLDTVEALAEQGVLPTTAAIENVRHTPERQQQREAARTAMLRRIWRVVTEELDELREAGAAPRPDLRVADTTE